MEALRRSDCSRLPVAASVLGSPVNAQKEGLSAALPLQSADPGENSRGVGGNQACRCVLG